jgi:hypothetical protein
MDRSNGSTIERPDSIPSLNIVLPGGKSEVIDSDLYTRGSLVQKRNHREKGKLIT